jgi:hypothetical protein
MADQTETVTEEATETVVTSAPPAAPSKTLDELAAENQRMQAALKEANKEAAARRKKLEEYEKAEQERKLAELSETDRLKQELAQAQARVKAAEITELQRSVADEVGLPAILAARIQGADREAMTADAKTLLAALPKAGAPGGSPTNPGGATKGETDAEKRKRLGLA